MRTTLNGILQFIGASSLTDEEWNSLDADALDSDRLRFDALKGVLASRESVSEMYRRLVSYFKAKGMTFGDDEPTEALESSNIFVGSSLA